MMVRGRRVDRGIPLQLVQGHTMANAAMPSRPPLALIVNDQEWWARSLESILAAKGYAVLRAYTGSQALVTARTARPDVIFIELQLPDIDGVEVCRALHEDADVGASVPIVLTASGAADRDRRLAAYKCGAWEFVSEPLDGELLMARLSNLMKARREAERLRSEGLIDDITGFYNLRGLARRAREMGAEAQRRRDSFGCVAIAPDVDVGSGRTTRVTTSAAGLAEQLGSVLRGVVRGSDAVGRLGQSEFAIVSVGTESAGIATLARRIQRVVDDSRLELEATGSVLRVSAGYYAVTDFANAAVDPAEILVRATTALREARASRSSGEIRAYQDSPALRLPSDPSRSVSDFL
jgi:diguanylate cyclase (GGDEF)-like protein